MNDHVSDTGQRRNKGRCFLLEEPFLAQYSESLAASVSVEMYRFQSWYCFNTVTPCDAPNETQRGRAFCVPIDNQSCLIVFAFIAAAVSLILRHIPFKSPGQAFIARAYQVDNGSCLNNWTISYQGWHPYKDLPLTASAQTGGNE